MTGAVIGIANKIIPINIAGADYILAGYFMKNPLVTQLGAITLGRSLAQGFTGNLGGLFGGAGGNGGGFE